MAKPDGRPNVALADFVAPAETGVADYIGAFAVTTGHGLDEIVAEFEAANDDYSAILAKALADRLAEAFAERLHQRVRRELWGYAPDEALSNTDLIAERYQGIRPAPGYPACPDHTEKGTLFDLLEAEPRAGIRLTESFAMWPGASRLRATTCGTPPATTSAWAGSVVTSWPTTPPGRASRSPRRNAGWPRTWPTRASDVALSRRAARADRDGRRVPGAPRRGRPGR